MSCNCHVLPLPECGELKGRPAFQSSDTRTDLHLQQHAKAMNSRIRRRPLPASHTSPHTHAHVSTPAAARSCAARAHPPAPFPDGTRSPASHI
eukprot:355120-Chlamydomonas_euryale.AAC.5